MSFSTTMMANLQPGRFITMVLAMLQLFSLPAVSFSAATGALTAENQAGQTKHLYKVARDYYYRLERDPKISGDRENWLKGIRNFRKIYLAAPGTSFTPSCLYMIARMYRRMYQQFHHRLDLDEAINYFSQVVSRFPVHPLADDALFTTAEIYGSEKKDFKKAASLYGRIIHQYPKGDKFAQAANRLNELSSEHTIRLPEQLAKKEALEKLVHIEPVRYWSSNDYTRIVIRAAAPVHYAASLLEKNGEQPRRLFIDFSQSYIPPKFRSPIPIQDGLLKQVRTGQFNDNTVRVVLDIESISDYQIFSLNDPFRVVIDVHGRKRKHTRQAKREEEKKKIAGSNVLRIKPRKRKSRAYPEIETLSDRKKSRPAPAAPDSAQGEDSLSLAQQLGLGVRRIVIDPGHGGKDPGAMAHGLKEKDIVLKVARKTAALLRDRYHYEVLLTRNKDVFLPLEERTAIANTRNCDLFVSIHVNAHPEKSARGVETFYLNLATNSEAMRVAARENATSTHNISELQDILTDLMKNSKIQESSRLARYVQDNLVNGLGRDHYRIKNLGVKQAPFYVLIGAEMPAVLAEISFITNPAEAELLRQQSYLDDIARQIAAGIVAYVEHHRTAALRM